MEEGVAVGISRIEFGERGAGAVGVADRSGAGR